jgi:hypothetical protein
MSGLKLPNCLFKHSLDSTWNLPDLSKGVKVCVSPHLMLDRVGDELRDLFAVDLSNPSKGDVNTSRNTRGRPDVAVFDPARAGYPVNIRTGRSSPGPGALVSRGIAAVENTCASGDGCTSANSNDMFDLARPC